MKGSFFVFSVGFAMSLILITAWNLNHVFNWTESGDRLYGSSIGVILVSCAYHIHVTARFGFQKLITTLFLFVSLSNLLDEVFFNPLIVNWYEYITALILTPIIYYYEQFLRRTEKNRN